MLRAVRAEREALEVGGDFLNNGDERFLAADLWAAAGISPCPINCSRLLSWSIGAPTLASRYDAAISIWKLLSGPTDDAFARRRLIEGAGIPDDGGHNLELPPNVSEVVLDHNVS